MTCTPLENLEQYDCVLIMTDHSDYDYQDDREQVEAGGGFAQRDQGNRVGEDRSLLDRRIRLIHFDPDSKATPAQTRINRL